MKTRMFNVLAVLAFVAALPVTTGTAQAFTVREVTSPGGIKAWVVEDHTVPLIAMSFSFGGGGAADPAGREGLANFLASMMDEGAGDLDSESFRDRRDDLSMRMSFEAQPDRFAGSFRTLTETRDASFELLGSALTAPRFDAEPLERVRGQIILGLSDDEQEPEQIAFQAWRKKAFGSHPYGRTSRGTEAGVAAIQAADLRSLARDLLVRDTLTVAVVGDIDGPTLGRLLDATFGGLPASGHRVSVPEAQVTAGPSLEVIERDIPQGIIQFGGPGLKRGDPDYMAGYVMNDMLGGSGFGSRLTDEIRERRGLTYSITTELLPFDHGAIFIGSAATRNERVGETIELIRHELARFAAEGPTRQELDDSKTYVLGSYALRFDTSDGIADLLVGLQEQNLGIDYITRRETLIAALSIADIRRVAKRLIDSGRLIVTVVGKPEGLAP